jgi:hypothetical protein
MVVWVYWLLKFTRFSTILTACRIMVSWGNMPPTQRSDAAMNGLPFSGFAITWILPPPIDGLSLISYFIVVCLFVVVVLLFSSI